MPPGLESITSKTKILIVGLGSSGLAAARFFHGRGAQVSVSEAGPKEKIAPEILTELSQKNIFLETGGHSPKLFGAMDMIVMSPGVPLDIEALSTARRRAVPIVGEMAIAAQYLETPVVAVTGTNGKTTVTTMLGDIFKAAGKKVFVGGNIGTPVFSYMSGPQDADIAVLELSSFQLDTAGGPEGFRPDTALLLNITPDHLDRYESFSAYAASKFGIFTAQRRYDTAIMNADDPEIMTRKRLWPASRKLFFGKQLNGYNGATLDGRTVTLSGDFESYGLIGSESYDLAELGINDSPNLENSAAAILAARLMGCPAVAIKQGLSGFSPLSHRITLVTEINGVRYYDDSKATNIGAVQIALASQQGSVILIAGGRDKGGDYNLLKKQVKAKVKAMILIGEARDKMAAAFADVTQVEKTGTMDEAVRRAAALAHPGDTVLLSPACASFDMFTSYGHRGDVFRKAVMALKKEGGHKN